MKAISFTDILPFLIPLVILQVAMIIIALLDLSKRSQTRGPRWLWVLIIILGEIWGPILYFIIGRKEE